MKKVKKDMRPSVRKEWHRLFQVKENEEKRAENVGRKIAVDCKKRQLILVNNLSVNNQAFTSALTFRQGSRWISELDLCFVSLPCLEITTHFCVHQRFKLPSDHEPISVGLTSDSDARTCSAAIEGRARQLGNQNEVQQENQRHGKRAIHMHDLEVDAVKTTLSNMLPPSLDDFSPDESADTVNNLLYACAESSNIPNENRMVDRGQQGDDSRALWKAINWNGSISNDRNMETPSETAFKEHFEAPLRHPENEELRIPTDTDVNIYATMATHRKELNSK
ncbi:hypothetical protein CAPTEDRAFT_209485 [Capitella teleta]|uniref:Endonuclease/exonuclease/phosphatase domain-containing protein n=1 Tax=Capitella teleta TaxID=283909 RepID=R7UGA1_CAPTE|nr:hypothetical protein CAPTEDRAFT_209485 [Capitella teleta]|eukprot:ELU02322.1 hypothetical protein CAPTEDRAFT_209485 [Capitella teleta]